MNFGALKLQSLRTSVLTNSIPFVRTDLIQDTSKMALCSKSFVRTECLFMVINVERHIAYVHNKYQKVTYRKCYFNAEDMSQ